MCLPHRRVELDDGELFNEMLIFFIFFVMFLSNMISVSYLSFSVNFYELLEYFELYFNCSIFLGDW